MALQPQPAYTTMAAAAHAPMTANERKVIIASSTGTIFEWYDFYLYGWTAVQIGASFWTMFDANVQFIVALLTFSAGFLVRPFGALVFGRIGDLVGRKYTFLVTILIMGLSTVIVGILPGSESWGIAAPIILIALRMLQGLALGGEYGGAATYVAEHAPQGRRGFYTSWIQTTATLGLFISLLVILFTRQAMGEVAFLDWGWRIPFLLSAVLLGISLWIRLQLNESPAFQKMKAEGTGSKAPLTEAFGQWKNAKWAILALFGLTMGQAVVWYTGQFYALFFIGSVLKVDGPTANMLIAWSLLLGTGGFVLFGWLSDKIGRKPIILTGCAIAALSYFPLFEALTQAANPALAAAQASAPVTVTANKASCSFQFDPVGKNKFDTSGCDVAKAYLAKGGVSYTNVDAPAGTPAAVQLGGQTLAAPDVASLKGTARAAAVKAYQGQLKAGLAKAGYPDKADPARIDKPRVIMLLTLLALLVTMVYGPIAALLVELFPSRIRYTSMSLPYHIGNGWFGGFLPTTAFAMVAATGNVYYGLWYPVVVAAATVVIGLFFLPETFKRPLED